MSIEIAGLIALGTLNLILGILIAIVCFRLSTVNTWITDVEKRVSRLEILTSLADSRDSRDDDSRDEEETTNRNAGVLS